MLFGRTLTFDWLRQIGQKQAALMAISFRHALPRPVARGAASEGNPHLLAHRHEPGLTDAPERRLRIDALVDVVVRLYPPLPGPSLSSLVSRLRFAVPQWREELTSVLQRAKERLSHARVDPTLPRYGTDLMPLRRDDVDWYWPADENGMGRATQEATQDTVRLLAPFDPMVHDRRRFELCGVGIPFRNLHTAAQAQTWLLRYSTALARPRDWLGQPLREER